MLIESLEEELQIDEGLQVAHRIVWKELEAADLKGGDMQI
jgi:hypothetical protein